MKTLDSLKIKLFADGADKAGMLELYANPWIKGFTTNPTLMRKAGISDYQAFAREIILAIPDRPISFEVFADDFAGMEHQALEIASWGSEVYVKVPVTDTKGAPTYSVIKRLAQLGVKVNVTAMMTLEQVADVADCLAGGPRPMFLYSVAESPTPDGIQFHSCPGPWEMLSATPNIELIWASPRELLNVFQAEASGCHIITATSDILKKLSLVGKDLSEYSLDTVKMFYDDARQAGYEIYSLATSGR